MNSNNLDNIKRNIRNLAKRCRGISYSTALVVLYAMLGINAFAEDVVTQGMEDTASKAQISTSADKLSQVLKDIKAENEKKLKNANLELVQLMEQGDQVVKSPWSSWQFGINYYYDNFRGTYKGRGDKKKKYLYEGIFTRSSDVFERSTSPDSKNYSRLKSLTDFKSGITTERKGLSTDYGLISVREVKEPISSFDVTASINPRNIEKGSITIAEKTVKEPIIPEAVSFEVPNIKVEAPKAPEIQSNIPTVNTVSVPNKTINSPVLPKTITFTKPEVKITSPDKPEIQSNIPNIDVVEVTGKTITPPTLPKSISFNPIAPNVELPKDPSLPEPPTFAIVLGADCNTGCNSSSATPRLYPNSNFNLNGRAEGNTPSILHYTWNDSDVPNPAARALAFKMYAESSSNPFTLGESTPLVGQVVPNQREYYFNSYNFGDEYSNIANSNYPGKNNQYFFVGGSRFIENDNGSGMIMIPEGFKLNLGGIFTLGLVSQGYQTLQKNAGTITDQEEKDDKYIKDMPYDHGQDYKLIKGPTEDYKIKRSADGYVGYKVGIALVQEDAVDGGKILNEKRGTIDFRGERSIGLYTYLPRQQSNREMINEGAINLSGKESYGMKYAATEKVNGNLRPKLVNEATGVINLRKNPNGVDKADNSAAMALMKDESITSGVTLSRDQAKNKGTISLTDVENSLGMFVNINSNMTNEGKIAVNSKIETTTGNNQAVNVAMRADNSGAEVINEAAGTISTDGAYAIGMLANKNAKAVNKGKIESTAISHGTGLMAMDNSTLTNSGSITLKGDDNIGVYLKGSKSEDNKFEANSVISITGNKSTGVLVADSKLKYAGTTKVSGDNVTGLVVDKTSEVKGTENGTIEVGAANAHSGEITSGSNKKGSYGLLVQKGGTFEQSKVDVTAYVKGSNSAGIYSEGNTTLGKANTVTSDGAINFFADNGTISIKGGTSETGQKSLLFYTKGNNAKIHINSPMTATIKGGTDPSDRGTAFYYEGTDSTAYTNFDNTAIGNWRDRIFKNGTNNTLSNLTLDMKEGSRLFVASKVAMNLTETEGGNLSSTLGLAKLEGENYKTFMLYDSKLTLNQDVDLNDDNNAYNTLEIANSSITNDTGKTISGSEANQTAMAQENTLSDKARVTLENKGTIKLSGENSTGIYAKKGKIINDTTGVITVSGANSTGIYALDNTEVTNSSTGEIKVEGKGATGIFYSDIKGAEVFDTSTSLENAGKITLSGDTAVGMYYEPGNIGSNSNTVKFKNTGEITATAKSNVGMYAKVSKDNKSYETINEKTITLGNGEASNRSIAMYTNATATGTNPLKNTGTITVGNNGIGMYGYEESTSGNITVGDKGIALYTQGGKVDVEGTSTLKVGNSNAVGIYTKGINATITSAGNYEIGNYSYGIINKGTGNNVTLTGGTAKLSEHSKFIYSEDTTGTITNTATVTATGGDNYGIYTSGTATNKADITMESGIGNVGALAKTATGKVINEATIKLGASSATDHSIGMVANAGTVINTNSGKIEVSGDDGLGLYAVTSGTIENSGTLKTTGARTVGVYAADTSNIKLKAGTVTTDGEKTTGFYLDKGKDSEVNSGVKIAVNGNESNGIFVDGGKLTYNGETTVKGDGVFGAVVGANGEIAATSGSSGTINVAGVSGVSNQTANRGTVALVVEKDGKVTGKGLDVTANIKGEKSVGIYSAGNAEIGKADIITSNGAVNFFANSGEISINKSSTVVTGTGTERGSLLFYAPTNTSKILINETMTATVKGDSDPTKTGSAFFYEGTDSTTYTPFRIANITSWKNERFGSTLSKLKLNMEANSRLFTASKVAMNLSDTNASGLQTALNIGDLTGSNYKTFMLYNSKLTINQNVNLNDSNDLYNKLEIANSSVINDAGKKISGSAANQTAIAQENNLFDKNAVTLENKGTIELSGATSTGIFAKNGIITNDTTGVITTTGTQSAGIYALNNTKVTNKGTITVGENSTGMFYSDIDSSNPSNKMFYETKTGLKNEGKITLSSTDGVGMYYQPGEIKTNTVEFKNESTGTITSTGSSNIGMYAEVSHDKKAYNTINAGTISLRDGEANDPTIGMYTNATEKGINPLENKGNITVGKNAIGMYGYEESTTGNITVGDTSTAMYSKGGKVQVGSSSTLTVGKNNAAAIFVEGNSGEVASAGNYVIGEDSYGMIVKGNSNTVNLTGGTATLSKDIKFIYSEDTTGTITTAANIVSTGGDNYGIYTSGKALNKGNITMTSGIGNVGLLSKGANGDVTNEGTIKVGASTSTDHSIGIVSNGGKSLNKGIIEVNGEDGLGLYAVNNGTVANSGTITAIGDSTVGAYAADISNINLTAGTIRVDGNKSTGYYLDKGMNSSISSGAKVVVNGNEANGLFIDQGKLTYNGETTVKGDGVLGTVVGANGEIAATSGTIDVAGTSGASNQTVNRGTVALVIQKDGKITGNGLDVTANITGGKSVGIYSEGKAEIGKADIITSNGAVNFFANSGEISINKASTVVTGTGTERGSLLFYAPTSTSKISINAPMTAKIIGSTNATKTGTVFFYEGTGTSSYAPLTVANMQTWKTERFGNTLGNLTLDMDPNSRLFTVSRVEMKLSDTNAKNLTTNLGIKKINGTDYKTFMLYNSKLTINQDVNLDNTNDPYNKLEIANSNITNEKEIKGTKRGQTAIAQENSITGNKAAVTVINKGIINLSGVDSTAIYVENGKVENTNTGKIFVNGDHSTGIYAKNNTEVSNKGEITVGKESTGIFYSDKGGNTNTGLKNEGKISLTGENAIAMIYEPGDIIPNVKFENTGEITSTAKESTGMYAKIAKNNVSYDTVNTGTITLGDSIALTDPNVAMYTNAKATGTNPLENRGNIVVGKNSIGIYGFEETNSGNITVGNAGIGMYSQGGDVNLTAGKISTGSDEAVGVYSVGKNQTIRNSGTVFNLGENSFGFVNSGEGNKIISTVADNKLKDNSVYIYSNDTKGVVENSTKLISSGDKNYGIYSAGKVTNNADIDFGTGIGNVGIYSIKGGIALNTSKITVGRSDREDNLYGIGMAAGYADTDKGSIENKGEILVNGKNSIGMYGSGKGSKVENNGTLILNESKTIGMFLDNGATGVNSGTIKTGKSGLSNVVGVYVTNGSTLENTTTGSIIIDARNGIGAYLKGGIVKNNGKIEVTGVDSKEEYEYKVADTSKGIEGIEIDTTSGSPIIKRNGIAVKPVEIEVNPSGASKLVDASSIGMYMDTSGINITKPIGNVGYLTDKADIIVGTEISKNTLKKDIKITDSRILNPYRESMLKNPQVTNWNIYSGSLTWIATASLDEDGYLGSNITMSKVPYTAWAGNLASPVNPSDSYNFLDGLEQRYGIEGIGTKENRLFQKITGIGKNEEIILHQAFDEMMGHQYGNLQQRIQETGSILDREFNYLKREWRTASKDSNKIKVFGMKGEYSTDTAGIIDYKSNSYGVAYLGENETFKLGNTTGWYTGIVHNTNKFEDIGKSKEEMLQAKLGVFNSKAFDDNNSLNWTIYGEAFAGYNKMDRKYLVVDEIFGAKARYWTYGMAVKNELSKDFRLTEEFNFKLFGSLKAEYGRFQKIRERDGEIKLEIKANDYISIKPQIGAELGYKLPMGLSMLNVRAGVAYENELGQVANGKNKARVAGTSANWFGIRGEKEDRRGNIRTDLNVGYDNSRYGITANVGYDTKGKNIRGGLGLRVIF